MGFSWLAFNLIATVVCLGFFLHTSSGEDLVLGKYSPTYGCFLLAITIGWLICAWWGWRRRERFSAIFQNTLGIFVITGIFALLVLPSGYIFLHQRSLEKKVFATIRPEAHAFFQIEEAPDYSLPLTKNKVRILALGGSTTYGPGLDRNEAYPAVLEKVLNVIQPEPKVEVLNAGVPWHTSMHSLLRYVGRYSDWKPNVFIVMHAFNDIFQTSEGRLTSGKYRDDYGHFFGALGQRINPEDRFAQGISRFFSKNWFVRTWYSDVVDSDHRKPKRPVDLVRSLPSFERNMRELVRRAKQDGVYVVLATQPYLYRNNMPKQEQRHLFYDYYYKDYALVPAIEQQRTAMDKFNDTTRKISRTTDTALVDLEAMVPKSSDLMFDDVHYTKQGAALVARIISESVDWNATLVAN